MKDFLPLRPSLFWEKRLKSLDFQKDAQFIIGRVLDFGNLEDWKAVKNFYGMEKIKEAVQKHIFSSSRDANFWAAVFNIPLNELKCAKRPSLKTPKAFLRK